LLFPDFPSLEKGSNPAAAAILKQVVGLSEP
jgi:hypothetical protein